MANNETDTRIVEMQFDAKDFDRGIKRSSKNLEDFKKLLNFDDAAKQLTGWGNKIQEANSPFQDLTKNVAKLAKEFTGIGSVSTYVAQKIKHAWQDAANSVERFVKSLTTDQIRVGSEKYDKLLKSVQTIKAATGDTEEEVYAVMKRLNEYTDQTSYNFSDMAQNIGKFTSVGISLRDAEKQMEGIANWAARSGAGITEASRAMYNLSQAMGVGALTMIDWKSIENAGMATKEFKNQLIQAGLAAGTLVKKNGKIFTAAKYGKQVEVTYKNLRETLSKKWADTETMQKAFESYYYEDLKYEDKVAAVIESTRDDRDNLRKKLQEQEKDAHLTWEDYLGLGKDSDETRQKIIDLAVEQKKLVKETNEEGYTVYKTLKKNGKQIEINTDNLKKFFDLGLFDESLTTVAFGLDDDALVEMSEKLKQVVRDALGDDDVILKKDWLDMAEAGLPMDQIKEASIQAGLAAGVLVKKGDDIVTKAKVAGKQISVLGDQYEESLKTKWFDGEIADKVGGLSNLAKSAYEAAQRCTTFKDALEAWKDMLSTGWMTTYQHVFGKLSDAMNIFSAICNKVSDQLSRFVELRNGILEKWSGNGGRESLWAAIIGESEDTDGETMFEGAYGLLDALSEIGDLLYDGFRNFVRMFVSDEDLAFFDEDPEYMFEYLGLALKYFTDSIRETIGKIREFFTGIPAGETESRFSKIQKIVEGIYAAVTLIWNAFRGISRFVGEVLGQLRPTFDAITSLFSYISQLFTGDVVASAKKNSLGDYFHALAESLRPVTTLVNSVVQVLVGLIAKVVEFTRQNGSLGITLENLVGLVAKFAVIFKLFKGGHSKLGKLAIAFEVLRFAIAKLAETGLLDKLVALFKSVWSKLASAFDGKSLLDIILSPFRKAWAKVKEFFGINSPSTEAEDVGRNVMLGFVNGITSGGKSILETLKSVFASLWEKMKTWFSSLFSSGLFSGEGGLVGRIKTSFTSLFSDISFDGDGGLLEKLLATITSIDTKASSKFASLFQNLFKIDDPKKFTHMAAGLGAIVTLFATGHKGLGKGVVKFAALGKALQILFDTLSANGLIPKIEGAAKSIIDGFANGLDENGKQLLDKVLAPFKAMWNAVLNFFGIHSPSVKAEEAGENLMTGFLNGVQNSTSSITSGVRSVFETIWTTITTKIQEIKTNIQSLVTDFGPSLKKFFEGTNFQNLLGSTKEIMKWSSIFRMGSGMVSFGKGIKQVGKGIKVFGKNLPQMSLSNLFSNMFSISNVINSNNSTQTDSHDISKSYNFSNLGPQLLEIAASIGILTLVAKEFIGMSKKDLEKVGICLVTLTGGLLAASMIANKVAGKGASLLGISAALLLIVAPMKLLLAFSWGSILDAAGKLSLVLIALVGAAGIAGTVKLKGLVGMAAAVNLLIVPLFILSRMQMFTKNGGGLFQGLLALSAVLIALGGAAKLSEGNKMKGLISTAFALTLLIIPIKTLSSMSLGQLAKGIIPLVVFMYAMTKMIRDTNGMEKGKLAGMVAAITALSVVGWLIGHTMNWQQALIGFAPIIGLLGMMSLMFREASKLNAEQMNSLRKIFGSFSLLVGVIAGCILALSQFGNESTTGIIFSFMGMTIALLVGAGVMAKLAEKTDASAIGKLAVVLGILSLVIAVSGGALVAMTKNKADPLVIGTFMGGIALLVASAGFMARLTKGVDKKGLTRLIFISLALSAVVAVAGGALVDMAKNDIDWKVVLAFTGGLAALIAALGWALPKLGALDPKAAVTGILVLAGAVVAIMGAISLMIPVVLGSVGNAMDQLASRLKTTSGLLKDFTDRMDSISEESMKHAMAIFEQLKDLVLKFVGFGDYNYAIQSVQVQLGRLSTAITTFFLHEGTIPDPANSKSFTVLQKFIDMAPALQTVSFGNLAYELFDLGVGLASFQIFTNDIGTNPPGVAALNAITSAAEGKSGVIGTLPLSLFYLGTALGSFQRNTAEITSADSPVIGFLQALFGQAENIRTLAGLELGNLGSQLSTLGGGIALYAKGASEATGVHLDELGNAVDENGDALNMEGAIGILKALGEAFTDTTLVGQLQTASNNLEGLAKVSNLGEFGANLQSIGSALATFANAANSMQSENADKAISLLTLLGEMGGYLTPENLKVANAFTNAGISGEGSTGTGTPLGMFALDVEALGGALSNFAILTQNAVFDGGFGALEYLAGLKSKLDPDNLAFVNAFTDAEISGNGGEGTGTPMGIFAKDITALGKALESFAVLTGNKTFDNGFGALEKLSDLNQKLTQDKLDFLNFFALNNLAGQNANGPMAQFTSDVGYLGTTLEALAKNLVDESGKPYSFTNGLTTLTMLANLSERLQNIKIGATLHSFIYGEGYGLDGLKLDMQGLGTALRDMANEFTGEKSVDFTGLKDSLTVVEQLVSIIEKLNFVNPETGGIWSMGDYFSAFVKLAENLTSSELGDRNGLYDASGQGVSVAHKLAEFAQEVSVAFDEANGIDTSAVAKFKDIAAGLNALMTLNPGGEFTYPGEMISLGIETGIRNGESGVIQAAIDVVTAAIQAANETADAHSPSRVFAELGEYLDAGLINGILGGQNKVADASSTMMTGAIDQAGLMMGAISQALAESVDLQPTITPVLDLSKIAAASGTLDQIFAGQELSLNSALNRANASVAAGGPAEVVVQNPTDLTGITATVSTLQTELQNLQHAISNMKIVLNNGVVAGGLTDDIDYNLGMKGLYNRRRNS